MTTDYKLMFLLLFRPKLVPRLALFGLRTQTGELLMLLHPDCIFTIRIAMNLWEILLKFGGELGANLCNVKKKEVQD